MSLFFSAFDGLRDSRNDPSKFMRMSLLILPEHSARGIPKMVAMVSNLLGLSWVNIRILASVVSTPWNPFGAVE
ncbi:MAG: hypothetical protein LN415_02100 [Candidatus Thermoplasmatota archaeon]|nr:hypothetical protein [Candidatus Thermoplasmatota archaeon]